MKKLFGSLVGAALVLTIIATAHAAVIFNGTTGTGWAGKGDVQSAFGWNNARMQQNHTSITFEYDETTTASWQCEWYTGPDHNISHHSQSFNRTRSIGGVLGDRDRKTGQWTGWHLTGFTDSYSTGGNVTPSCPGNPEGNGNSGEKTVVEGSVNVVTAGGLYAVFGGDRRLIN
jgi:hypothetical protein